MQCTLEELGFEDDRERPDLDAAMAGPQQLAVAGLLHHEDGPGQVPLLALLQRQQARLEQPQQQAAHLHELTLCISEKNVTEMCIWSWLIFYIYCNLLYCVFIKTKLIKNVTFRLVISHAIHQFYFFSFK